MTRNAELLNRLADHFEAHPETWKQDTWGVANECGTFACIAGTAVIFTYGEAAFTPAVDWDGRPVMSVTAVFDIDGPVSGRALVSATENIDAHAGRLLGLVPVDAERLFGGGWRPAPALGLPGALRALANGATVDEVSA